MYVSFFETTEVPRHIKMHHFQQCLQMWSKVYSMHVCIVRIVVCIVHIVGLLSGPIRCRLLLDRHLPSIFSSLWFPLVVIPFDVSAGFDPPSKSVLSCTPACTIAWFAPFPDLDADSLFWG